MAVLELTLYGNPIQRWLIALAVAVVAGAGLRWVKARTARWLRTLVPKTSTDLDDLALNLMDGTRSFFFVVLAAAAGAQVLVLPVGVGRAIAVMAGAAVLVQAGLWGNAVITFSVSHYIRRRLERDAASVTTIAVLSFVAKLALWTIVLLVALDNLGVNITGLVAGLGVGGIAVALALQNVLGDLFAAFSIALDRPFSIGDFIIVDDLLGTVEYIGLKTTRVRSLSGEQLIFANSDLLTSRIRNFKRMSERRVVFTFGVVYETPVDTLAAIPAVVRRITEDQPQARFDRAHFKDYGDSGLNFEVVYYVLTADYNTYMDVQQAINLQLYREFQEQGIEFAYPTRTLYVRGAMSTVPQRVGSDS